MHLEHISDWIEAAVNNGDDWLSNIDEHGRPKKLLKFSNIMQIVQEANRDMALFAEKHRNVILIEGDEEIVERFENGYHLVRLLTPNALDRESGQMQHCIGQGAYDDHLDGDEYEYFSLRDPFGKPHVTIEIGVNRIAGMRELIQFQGKQNQPPVAKYQEMMIPYFQKQKIQILQASPSLPYVTDINGNWFSIYDLPENLEIKVFSYTDYGLFEKNWDVKSLKPIKLPKHLVGTQRLNIYGACLSGSIETYPDNMNFILNGVYFADKNSDIITSGDVHLTSVDFFNPPAYIEANCVHIVSSKDSSFPVNIKSSNSLIIVNSSLRNKLTAHATSLQLMHVDFGGIIHDLNIEDTTLLVADKNGEVPRGLTTKKLSIDGLNNFIDFADLAPDYPAVSEFIVLKNIDINFPDDYPEDIEIRRNGKVLTVEELKDEMSLRSSQAITTL
jgi:hypothetical protein